MVRYSKKHRSTKPQGVRCRSCLVPLLLLTLIPASHPPPSLNARISSPSLGEFADLDEICRRLRSEGYRELYIHFGDRSALQADLSRMCRRAQGRPEPANGKPPRHPRQQSPAQRFSLKDAECRQIDKAQGAESRQMYLQLALSYEELAAGEKTGDAAPQTAHS